jgi:predicted ATP-grasp superfamily ATP-dependent carboligase
VSVYFIAIEEIREMQKRRNEINKLDLCDIIWTENNEEVKIDSKVIEDFELTGLNNIDFITSNYYKGPKRFIRGEN